MRICRTRRGNHLPFAALLAFLVVFLRLALFDYQTFFRLESIPNHDMYQAAPLFSSNMHSMRIGGDIAWWNPATRGGHAQYYMTLLSPVAPTLGHIAFIVWAEGVRAMSLFGVSVPEYFQYLILTYVVGPFLAALAWAWTCGFLFRSRASVALATLTFGLSTLGLWNSAWFYFQEPATLLFLLGSALCFLRRPGRRSLLLLVAAGLVQFASLNYWTLFNSWLVAVLFVAYAVVYPYRLRRAGRRVLQMKRAFPRTAAGLAALVLVVASLWAAVIGATLRDEASLYLRGQEFTVDDATWCIEAPFYLPRAFHPDLEAVAQPPYNSFLTMHKAIYLGAFLIPPLLALFFFRWRRLERWLLLSGAALTVICFAPPPVLWVWEHLPGMKLVRHVFMFYPYYVRVVLLLLACAGLDRILTSRPRRSMVAAVSFTLGVAGTLLLGGSAFGPLVRLGGAPAALIVLVSAGVVALALYRPSARQRAALAGVVLLVALVDLATYFRHACGLDNDFTITRFYVKRPLRSEFVQSLRSPWPPLLSEEPAALFSNMPVANNFWPVNIYMPHRFYMEASDQQRVHAEVPLVGYHADEAADSGTQLAPKKLLDVRHEWHSRNYNDWSMVVEVPKAGWLSVAQIHDASWHATIDGDPVKTTKADGVRTAIPVTGGTHEVRMEYRPLARRLYWPSCAALQLALLLLAVGAVRVRRGRAMGSGGTLTPLAAESPPA